jgi:hypothetical protein
MFEGKKHLAKTEERHEAINKRVTSALRGRSSKCLEVNGGIFEHLIKQRVY